MNIFTLSLQLSDLKKKKTKTVGISSCLEADVLSNIHKVLLFTVIAALGPVSKGSSLIICLIPDIMTISTSLCSLHCQLVALDHREGPSIPE